jgi:hypothetical protein
VIALLVATTLGLVMLACAIPTALQLANPNAEDLLSRGAYIVFGVAFDSLSGGHDFVAYAHSAISGLDSVVSVPVFIGTRP